MNETELLKLFRSIRPLDKNAMEIARAHCGNLIKPPGSLGRLEDIAVTLAGISGHTFNTANNGVVIVMCADNGVFEEGVALTPQKVSALQTINMARGLTGAAVLANAAQAKLKIIDLGLKAEITHPGVTNKKIRYGTGNIAKGPAMTRDEAVRAIAAGVEAAFEAVDSGADILGAGEMGIGNTTTAAALVSLFTGLDARQTVGKGAGLSDSAFERKKAVVTQAIKINRPNAADPIDALAKIGGLDIAGMAGVILGAAVRRAPVVIDGFISASAALVANKINPLAASFMIPSHRSAERGYSVAMSVLGLNPMLDLNMRLGEGSGCPLAFFIIKCACLMMSGMGTFEHDLGEVAPSYLKSVNQDEMFHIKDI